MLKFSILLALLITTACVSQDTVFMTKLDRQKVISLQNRTNDWNSAFNWGNHADYGYASDNDKNKWYIGAEYWLTVSETNLIFKHQFLSGNTNSSLYGIIPTKEQVELWDRGDRNFTDDTGTVWQVSYIPALMIVSNSVDLSNAEYIAGKPMVREDINNRWVYYSNIGFNTSTLQIQDSNSNLSFSVAGALWVNEWSTSDTSFPLLYNPLSGNEETLGWAIVDQVTIVVTQAIVKVALESQLEDYALKSSLIEYANKTNTVLYDIDGNEILNIEYGTIGNQTFGFDWQLGELWGNITLDRFGQDLTPDSVLTKEEIETLVYPITLGLSIHTNNANIHVSSNDRIQWDSVTNTFPRLGELEENTNLWNSVKQPNLILWDSTDSNKFWRAEGTNLVQYAPGALTTNYTVTLSEDFAITLLDNPRPSWTNNVFPFRDATWNFTDDYQGLGQYVVEVFGTVQDGVYYTASVTEFPLVMYSAFPAYAQGTATVNQHIYYPTNATGNVLGPIPTNLVTNTSLAAWWDETEATKLDAEEFELHILPELTPFPHIQYLTLSQINGLILSNAVTQLIIYTNNLGIATSYWQTANNIISEGLFSQGTENALTNEQDLLFLRSYYYGSPNIIESPTNWFTFSGRTITGFNYEPGREFVVVPWILGGVQVQEIGEFAFSPELAGTPIIRIVFPKGLISIGGWAFSGCTQLESVSMPDTIKIIGNNAFDGCYNLGSVDFPNSVMDIGVSAFYGCSLLSSVSVGNSITNIDLSAFEGCSSLTSLVVYSSEMFIDSYSFYDCVSLADFKFYGDAPKAIGTDAFYNTPINATATVFNAQATGWGTNLTDGATSIPVTRPALYADAVYQSGKLVATTEDLEERTTFEQVNGIIYSNSVSQMIIYTNTLGVATSYWQVASGVTNSGTFSQGTANAVTNNQDLVTFGALNVNEDIITTETNYAKAFISGSDQAVMSPLGTNNVSGVWKGTYANYLALTNKSETVTYIITDDPAYDTTGIYQEFDAYNVIPDATTTVYLVQEKSIYTLNVTTNTTLAFDFSDLNFTNKTATFELHMNIVNTNAAVGWTLTGNQLYWVSGIPALTQSNTYYFVFRAFNPTNVHANLQYQK